MNIGLLKSQTPPWHRHFLARLFPIICLVANANLGASAVTLCDYAEARHRDDWLRHPVYGDPSFDSFQRLPGNPIHRGAPPFEWPVNGFFFPDPQSRNLYVFVGDYGKGYMTPPSRCLLYRSNNHGHTWTNLGPVLHGEKAMFDRGGHTPDVSVVFAENRYHMVYDWGEADFNAEGGLAYAWADRPEGPWHRAPEPITRNSTLSKLSDRYQRTYAATLLRRTNDWLILGMMDHAPNSWALFAMTAPRPEGPYSERRLVRHVEGDYFHPPLLEFFPAFAHEGAVYAPATSVALNRNFNVLFKAPLERAEDPAAWSLFQHGSLWHAADHESEFFGIWGQTFSGAVMPDGHLRVMFPSRDRDGRGTINLAQRLWDRPFRKSGFVLSGHAGPSLTLLRPAYANFTLNTELQLRGTARLLLNYTAPLGPNAPTSDATLHPLSNTRHLGLELASGQWRLCRFDTVESATVVASGKFLDQTRLRLKVKRVEDRLTIELNHRELWSGQPQALTGASDLGLLGWRVEANSHLTVEKFSIQGEPAAGRTMFLQTEALLGAGAAPGDWDQVEGQQFRFGSGALSRTSGARAKWNVIGTGLRIWSPRGPHYGTLEVLVDGRVAATLDLHSTVANDSAPLWEVNDLPGTFHAVAVTAQSGRVPLDCLEVWMGRGTR